MSVETRSGMNMEVVETVESLQKSLQRFSAYDYVVFIAMLVGCAAIGIFYAFRSRSITRQGNGEADEYLLGGRNMSVFPVAMSLIASFVSGISLLGTPTETYLYGTEYMFLIFGVLLNGLITCFFFLPVFHEMQLSSTYEYLERRFDRTVRLFGSLLFSISLIVWLPIVIYVPALAFNQVTGINVHITTPVVCIICIFYTCVGGIKAVVWTDVVQTLVMVGAMIVIVVKGSLDIGGFHEVWQRSVMGERIVLPSFEADPTIRHTFWGLTFGILMLWIQNSMVSQNMIQRYLALPTLSHARWALWIFTFGTIAVIYLCSFAGLVAYATYYNCDPLTTKLAKKKDQLLPVLVMKVLGDYPGLPGIFIAGIFSASLSSLSTALNSMSAVVLEDFIKAFYAKSLSERAVSIIMRSVVIVFGLLNVFLVFVVEKLGTLLQLSYSMSGVTSGPQLGVFICGIFLPWVDERGALFGGIAGLFASGFLVLGTQNSIANNKLTFITKPTSVEGCTYDFNSTSPEFIEQDSQIFPLFKLSYLWHTMFGTITTILVAILISCFTARSSYRHRVDPICVSPLVRKYVQQTESQRLRAQEQELITMLKRDKAPVEVRRHQ